MNEKLSKFERIRLTKPKRVIDASVILETIEEKDYACNRYLSKAGYDYRAYITIPLLGEVLLGINRLKDEQTQINALMFINKLTMKHKLDIIPIREKRDSYLKQLKEAVSVVPLDDLTHISNILEAGFNEFVTIDKRITNTSINKILSEKFKLKAINPQQI